MNAAKSRIIALTVLVLSLTVGLPCAHAATTNWLGTTSADWNLAGNWDNGVPTAGNDAVFPAVIPGTGATITVAASMAANSITFNGTYTLTGGDITLTAGNNLNAAATKIGTINSVLAGTTVGINGINAVNLALTTGTVVLGGANTYNGATTIAAGIASVTNASGLGAGTVTVTVANGAELEVNAAVTITNKNASLNGTGVSGSAFTAKNNVTWSGTFTTATATTVSVDTGFTLTLGNAVPLTATGLLTKTGAGNVAFAAGVSTGAAGVTINAGVFIVNGSSRIDSGNIIVNSGGTFRTIGGGTDSIGGGRTITVNTGGILDWQQTGTETFAGLTLNGTGAGAGAMINAGNTAGGVITAAVTIGSNTTINTGTGSLSLASAISGATFSLTKTGTGTLVVSNANTCAALNIFAGVYSGRAALGSNPYGTGTITLGDSANVAAPSNLQISQNISTSYPNPIVTGTNMNAGTLQISDPSGANITFSGAITLNNSNLAINNSNGQANSILNFTGGVTGTGNLTLNGSGAGSPITFSTGVIDMVGTITNASTNAGGLVIVNSAIGTNVTGVFQSSTTAPLLLGGNNTYSGAVTVTGSALDVTTGGTVLGPVNISTANLSGRGTINGAVTLAGTNPTLTPGDFNNNGNGNNANGIGTLTVANNVTFSTPGTQTYQLGASGNNDKLVTTGTGNVSFGASGSVRLVALSGFDPSATYTLVDTSAGTGTISGAATLAISMPGYTFVTNQSTATNTLTVGPFTARGAATQLTWVGGTGTDLATAANWSPAKSPTDASGPFELIFTATNAGTLTNTMTAGTNVLALTFTAGNYTLSGNQIVTLANATSLESPFGTGISLANGANATVLNALDFGNLSTDLSVGTGSALTLGGIVTSPGQTGAGLTKSGLGTLTFSAVNTFVGGLTLNAGVLNFNNVNAIGSTGTALVSGILTINGGSIDNTSGAAITTASSIVANADIVYTGSNSLTFSGTVALGADRTITTNSTNNSVLTLSGIVSGTASLTKDGPSQLTLTNANTFAGNVNLNGGTLSVGNGAALGNAANTVTINGGTRLDASAGTTLGNYPMVIAGDFTFVGTNALNVGAGAKTIAATRTIITIASTLTIGGTVGASTAGLVKNGNGTLLLSGSSPAYSGTFIINAGTFNTTNATTIATTSNIVWGPGSTGAWSLGANQTVASINTDAVNPGAAILTNSASSTLTINGATPSVFAGTAQQTVASLAINKTTAGGSLTLSGTNTYGGTTTISAGTLNINGPSAIGTGQLTIVSGAILNNTSGAPITMSTNNAISMATGFTFTGSNNLTFSTGTATMTASTAVNTTAGTLTIGGPVAGAFALTKAGAGTLVLSGTNTYSVSPTNVSAGTLLINGSTVAGVTVAVAAGGSVGGSGSILGPLTVANTGSVNPGQFNQTGTLTTAAITNTATPAYNFQLNAAPSLTALAGNDFISSGGATIALGASSVFNISGGGNFTNGGVYKLIATTGTVTGTAMIGSMPSGWTGVLSATTGTGVTLTVTQAATTFVWNGSVSGDMGLAANWTPNTVPTSATGANLVFGTTAGTKALIFNNPINGEFVANSVSFGDATGYSIAPGSTPGNIVTALTLPASSAALTPLICNAGTNVLNIDLNTGSGATGNNIAVSSGATLSINGTTGTTLLTPSTQLTLSNAGTLNIGAIIAGGATNISIGNATGSNAGVTTFSGANNYSGTTAVNFGTLKLGSTSALGTSSVTTIAGGAVLDLAGQVLDSARPVTISSTGIANSGAITNSSTNPASNTGAITLAAKSSITNPTGSGLLTLGAIDGSSAFDLTLNAVSISGLTVSGAIGSNITNIAKTGAGLLTLNGANTYVGTTTVSVGTLQVGNASALGASSAGTVIASGAALDLNGTVLNPEPVSIAGTGSGTGVVINSSPTAGAAPGAITMTAASTIFNVSAGGITLGSVSNSAFLLTVEGTGPTTIGALGSGSGGLTKNGTGTLTLSGVNTYSGPTLVDNGGLTFTGGNQALGGALTFGAVAGNTNACALSLVSSNVRFAGLFLVRTNTVTNTVSIDAGSSLSIGGGLTMGIDGALATTTLMTVSGGGSMAITGGSVQVGMSQTTANAANNSVATLDLSGLSGAAGFGATVTNFNVGQGNTSGGIVTLTNTANTITATTMNVGNSGANNGIVSSSVTLGTGTNVFFVDTINCGIGKITGTIGFASQAPSSPGSVSIAPRTNSGTVMVIGSNAGTNTAAVFSGTLDFAGHNATVAGGAMQLGICGNTLGGSTTGTINFDTGSFSVTTLDMANKSGTGGTGVATGTLNIGTGVFSVTGATFRIAIQANAATAVGTVNLNGGTIFSAAPITDGGGTSTTTLNLNSGTVRAGLNSAAFMTGLNFANVNAGVTIDTNGFDIAIGQALIGTGTGAITKIGAGTLTLNGINTYTGATTVSAGMLGGTGTIAGPVNFDPNTALAPGNAGIGTLTMNSSVAFNGTNFTCDLGVPGPIGGTFNDLAAPASGSPSLDFGATPGTLTVIRQNGFNVGTYTLISGYTLSNTANLPTVAPIAGVTMNTSVVGNTLLLNVTSVTNTPSGALATWTGTAADHNWSNPANWGGTNITVGGPYELIFPSTATDFISNNDIVAGITLRSILITSGTAYTIGNNGGGAVTINGTGTYSGTPITVLAGTHSISTTTLVWTANSVIYVGAGGLSLTSNITNSTFTTFFNTAVNMNYDGILGAGSGGIFKLGVGTLTLNGVNSFTGNNTIIEGTLSISQPGNLGLGAAANSILFPVGGSGTLRLTTTQTSGSKGILLSSNAIIDIPNAGDTWTLNAGTNVISGTRGFTKTGAGTLILSQANTLSGPVTLNAGTLQLGNATGLGPAASAQLNFGPGSTGVLALNGTNVTVVGLNTDPVTLGTPIIRNGSAATACTLTVNNTIVPSTFAGTIQNGGAATLAITKNGAAGTLLLSGNNTHTGTTTITAGTLKLGSATALGAATVTLNTTAGTLDLNGNNLTIANLGGNAANTITDTAAGVGTSTLTVTALSAVIPNLILDGASRVVAIEVGNNNTNTAILSNLGSTFSGGLTLLTTAGGTRLGLATATAANLGAGTAGAIVSGPFGRGPIIIGKVATDKAGIYISAANVTIFNDIVFNTALGTDRLGIRVDGIGCAIEGRVMCNNSNALISTNGTGVMTIKGKLTSIGAGATGLVLGDPLNGASLNVILSNTTNPANDYTGDTVIQNRATTTLTLGANDQIPDGAGKGNLSVVGASSNFNLAGFSETVNGLSGGGIIDGLSGTASLTAGNNDQTSSFTGIIRNTAGTLALTKVGTGTLTLAGANTYVGATTVNGGVLKAGVISVANTSGAFGRNSALSLADTPGVVLDITGFNNQLGSLSGGGTTGGTVTLGAATLTVGGDNTSPSDFAGTITGTGALTKIGTGTLTLAGANTYSGATTVSAGSLLVTNASGSATGTGAVSVAAGSTLGGSGTISGIVTVNGNVAPGVTGIGILTIGGNITFNSGSSLIVDLVGATGDQLAAGGSVTFGANVTLNATATTPTHGNTFAIISKSGAATITGTFNTLVENTPFLISGRPFLIQYASGDGNDVVLVDNDVPVFTAAGTNSSQPLDEVEPLAALLATDPDGDALTFTLFSGTLPAAVTLNTDGTFSGMPSFGTAGVYSAVIQATDTQGAFVRTTLSITVNAVRATINNLTIAEFAGTATLTVTRSGLGHQTVTVQAITVNGTALAGSDYTSTSVLVTIPAGQLTQTVSIPILDDTIAEPSESFTVGLSAPTNALIGTDGTGLVTLMDDESTPTLSVSTVSVSEAAGTVQITVSLVGVSSQSISVNYGTSNVVALSGLDYIGASGTLTWLPAELGSKTFTVQILEDALDENDESFNVNLSNVTSSAALGQASASVVILDNDLPPVAVNDSAIVGQNVPTIITVLTNDTGLVNTPVAVSVFFGPAHGTVNANADNTFTYTSDSTFAGFDSFIYRVTDAVGQTSIATVLIDVRAGPTFTSTPTLSPNPALAGQTILGSAAFVNGTITWNWGDGSPLETTANVSHVYQTPGIYTVVATLTSPEGVQSTIQTQIFIGLGFGDGSGGGGGGGANPPGVSGILVGAGGAGKLQGGSGKLAVSYVRRDKTTFSGSLGQLSLPATLTQTALTGLSSKLTIGTGATAAQFPFALGKTGKAKAPGLTSFELSVKKKRIRFSARREDLTAIMESLGAVQQNPVDKTKVISLLIPATAQVGDKIYLAMTFAIKFKQTNTTSGKGGL